MDLDKIITQIHDTGLAWVEADLKARQLEEDKKPYLAALMNSLDKGDKTSEAKLERLASGSKEYRDYITGMCIARAEALRKKVTYEGYQNLFEGKRTELATEREKLKKGIFHEGA